MNYVEQDLRERRVVFDDQRDAVARLEVVAVVGDLDDLAVIAGRWLKIADRGSKIADRAIARKEIFNSRSSILDPRSSILDPRPSVLRLRCRRLVNAGHEEREDAALARRADDANFAAQQPRDLAADREAEPRAAVFAAGRPVGLLEGLEDDSLFFERNADAGVADRKGDHLVGFPERLSRVIAATFGQADVEQDAPLVGELECVREEVLENLLQSLRVGVDGRRQVRRAFDRELQPLVRRQLVEADVELLDDLVERRVDGVYHHHPGFDLREVEDVVDQREQVGAGRADRLGELHLLAGQIALDVFGELAREDEHRVERRAQLVRHIGQEFGLVFRGQGELYGLLLQARARLLDLEVLGLDLRVLPGELFGLLLKLLVGVAKFFTLHAQPLFRFAQRERLLFESFVGLLQLVLLALQLGGELLRLDQEPLGPRVGLDGVDDDADALGQLVEEGDVSFAEAVERR